MKKLISKEFIIGVCVIVALIILYFGINFLKGVNLFKPGTFYYINYENVAGLETAASVTVDGYKVGEVRSIDFNYDKPGLIKVAVSLDKKLQVPDDSRAVIVSALLGGPSIELILGKSTKMVPADGFIQGALDSGMMSTVTNEIMPTVTDALPRVDSLLMRLDQTAANLSTLTGKQALNNSLDNIDRITSNLALLSQTLNQSLGSQVPALMGSASEVASNIKTVSSDLTALTNELNRLPLQNTMQNVYEVTDNLKALTTELNSTNGTLGKLMNDPTLYYQLNRITADIDSLINDVKANPKRYINIKLL